MVHASIAMFVVTCKFMVMCKFMVHGYVQVHGSKQAMQFVCNVHFQGCNAISWLCEISCKFMVTCIAKQLLHLTVNSVFINLIGLFSVKLIFQKTLSFGDALFHCANLITMLCFVFGHSYHIVNVIV